MGWGFVIAVALGFYQHVQQNGLHCFNLHRGLWGLPCNEQWICNIVVRLQNGQGYGLRPLDSALLGALKGQ